MDLQVKPLALNSWSELWVTLPATCPALGTGERPFLWRTRKVTMSSSPDFEALTSLPTLVPVHPKCDQETDNRNRTTLRGTFLYSSWIISYKRKKTKEDKIIIKP